MAANKSENKIKVTKLFGGGGVQGGMDPKVNQRIKRGQQSLWIVGLDSGNFQVSLALTSGGTAIAKSYPHEIFIDVTVASGWGWPTGGGSIGQGHSGVFPNGVPVAIGSGTSFQSGDGTVHTFGR